MSYRFCILFSAIIMASCSPKNKVIYEPEQVDLDTFIVSSLPDPVLFKGSEKKTVELIHTKLDLNIDWQKTQVIGKAEITLKPYRYPVNEFHLDARGFVINELKVSDDTAKLGFHYDYDGSKITVKLKEEIDSDRQIKVYLDYIATPDSLKEQGGTAILSDKGLYFIKDEDLDPINWQLWTQGETEANSAWFPTIDAPNQKMTQEIILTVDSSYATLSNGILLFSNDNNDGTRTDFWKMDKKHAPYLCMLAVGNFEVVKDNWRNIEVSYYMEPEYEKYAMDIFGLTPEMLEFYSNYLDYPYPWSKYSQIAVKYFVSGAMENTTAVVHGDFILQTTREMLDKDYEDYIAHELFHHWFGDLVTSESWANLALNESFATYGEYLWIEHKYGRDAADYHLFNDMKSYLREAGRSPKSIIRYDYENNDQMFDAHSYQKGGLVLHMLRNYLGEMKFKDGLKTYLNRYNYQTAEMADLRKVFEEVSGEDLYWFFDQWFYKKGHPSLKYSWKYNDELNEISLFVNQEQNFEKMPLFRLPFNVDIYYRDTIVRMNYTLNKAEELFKVESNQRPLLVNFNADKTLLCEENENKEFEEWAYMYDNAPLFKDRYTAATNIINSTDTTKLAYFRKGFKDEFWKIRQSFVYGVSKMREGDRGKVKDELIRLSQNDEKSLVRSSAIDILSDYYSEPDLEGVYMAALQDSSYEVIANALFAITSVSKEAGLREAKKLEEEDNVNIIYSIANLYSSMGDASHHSFYEKAAPKINGYEKFSFINAYSDYVERQSDSIVLRSLDVVKKAIVNEKFEWLKIAGIGMLKTLEHKYDNRILLAQKMMDNDGKEDIDIDQYRLMKSSAENVLSKIQQVYSELLEVEKSERIKKMIQKKGE